MAEYKNMPSAVANLVRTLLSDYDDWEVHSFSVDTNGDLIYGNATISAYDDETYLGSMTTHEHCGDQHLMCELEQIQTDTAHEVLEWASVNGYRR